MQSFQDLGLKSPILQALTELGFTTPSPVQAESIPYALAESRDLVALAATGTGKTAGFSLPILHHIDESLLELQAMVICPTRELCMQISADIRSYAKYMQGISVVPVYGGADIVTQIRGVKRGAQIVVGTPGRLLDLIKKKVIRPETVKWLVLDEADEMLNKGFLPDIDTILATTPETKQTLLFSATMPREVANIAKRYMHDYKTIEIKRTEDSRANITHTYFLVHAQEKFETLRRLIDATPDMYGIVFCRTKRETQEIGDKLMKLGYKTDALHGDIAQEQRTHVMKNFKQKHIQLLIATDVAARGIDVDKLTHVIQYGPSDTVESYVHRSGRTGRAGNTGHAWLILHHREKHFLRDVERIAKVQFVPGIVPSKEDILGAQISTAVNQILTITVPAQFEPLLATHAAKLAEMDPKTLAMMILTKEFAHMIEHYQQAPDLRTGEIVTRGGDRGGYDRGGRRDSGRRDSYGSRDRGGYDRGDRGSRGGYAKASEKSQDMDMKQVSIPVGRSTGVTVQDVFQLVRDVTGRRDVEIGRINIRDNETSFELDTAYAPMFPHTGGGSGYHAGGQRSQSSQGGRREGGYGRSSSSRPSREKWDRPSFGGRGRR